MAQFENMRKVELKNGEPAVFSLRQLYYADIEANRIGVIVYMDGEPFALSGTCTGTAIRADGATVPMTGTVEGNQAYITLNADCYAVEGDIQIFVKLTTGTVTATLAAARGTVRLTETGAVIDPGEIIPSVSALITAIDDAVASIPADYSDLLADIAPNYADLTFPVTAGTWCWYNGSLYRAVVDIASAESWTAAHWASAPMSNALAGDIQDLKSAFEDQRQTYNIFQQRPYFSQVQRGNPATIYGVTYTVQPNGEVLLTGKATANSTYYISGNAEVQEGYTEFVLNPGQYILWLEDYDHVSNYVSVRGREVGTTNWTHYFTNFKTVYTVSDTFRFGIGISVSNGTVLPEQGITVKPMIYNANSVFYGYIAPWASLANYVPQMISDITEAKTDIIELQSDAELAFQFRGYLDALGITALTSCTEPGWYSCGTSYTANITDLPSDFGTDNITALFVYGPSAASISDYYIYQEILSGQHVKWYRTTRKNGTVYSEWVKDTGKLEEIITLQKNAVFDPISPYYEIAANKYWNIEQTTAVLTETSGWSIAGPETGIDVTPGEIYKIMASQGATEKTRIWVLTDSNYNIIETAPNYYTSNNKKYESYCFVPKDATKLLITYRSQVVTQPRILVEKYNLNFDPVKNVTENPVFVSGSIDENGSAVNDNTRIRVRGNTMPRMKTNDYIEIKEPYEAQILAYSTSRYSPSSSIYLKGSVTGDNYVSGIVQIPAEYNGLYFTCIVRNKTTPSADISEEVATVGDYVDFVSVQTPTEYAKLNILHGLKLSVMGDSMSAMAEYIPEGNASYYSGGNHGVFSVNQMWWKVLCDLTGMAPLVINAWSGSGVNWQTESRHADIIPMSDNTRCNGLHDGSIMPDIIIIAGGTNDYSYSQIAQNEPLTWDGKSAPTYTEPSEGKQVYSSFTEAYAAMIKKLQANYPNAIIVACSTWFTMRGADNGYTLTHTSGSNIYTQADYDKAIESVCKQMRIPYITINDIGFNRNNYYPTYASDSETETTHMNARGQIVAGTAIAEKIVEAVKGFFA